MYNEEREAARGGTHARVDLAHPDAHRVLGPTTQHISHRPGYEVLCPVAESAASNSLSIYRCWEFTHILPSVRPYDTAIVSES